MQPCLSPVWDTVLATHALLQGAVRARRSRDRPRGRLAARQADPTTRRLGGAQPGAARRLVLRGAQRVLPRRRRHLHGAHGAGASARGRHARSARRGDAARPGLDAGDAERRRRLGQLRSRQRQAVADARPVRRPQRDDRSQHRRHHGARARVPEPPSRATAPRTRPWRARSAFSAAIRRPRGAGTAAGGSITSTAPGRCCAACAPSARTCRRPTCGAPSRWLLSAAERRRRLGREHRQLRPPCAERGWRLDAQPDRLGDHGARRRRRGATARPSGAASCTCSSAQQDGTWEQLPGRGPGSRGSSISTTIITGTTSRSWRCRRYRAPAPAR